MQASTLLSWRRSREAQPDFSWNRKETFFQKHRIGDIVRGLIFSSVAWGLLAVGVYAVYSIVLGGH